MKKKGFTLIELIGVIILVAVVAIMAVPPILNLVRGSKDEISGATEEILLTAADLYTSRYSSVYRKTDGYVYCVTLQELVDDNILEAPVVDAITGNEIPLTRVVEATVTGKLFEFKFNDACSPWPLGNLIGYTQSDGDDDEYQYEDDNYLSLPIKRNKIETIEIKNNIDGIDVNAGNVYDVSVEQNESVLAWYTDTNSNGLYEVYVGSDGNVIASSGYCLFCNMPNLKSLDVTYLDTSKVKDMAAMFDSLSKLTTLSVNNFDTSRVTNMRDMFYGMTKLTSLDVSKFDTSNVKDMNGMFYEVSSLTSLDVSNFNTSKVEDMGYMFAYMSKITTLDVSNFNTSNVTNMAGMFRFAIALTAVDVNNFNTSKVESMAYMFGSTIKLTSLDLGSFDTSNVTSMGGMFIDLPVTQLNLSNFNTSKVKDMANMFDNMTKITSLDLSSFDTSSVTNMYYMFKGVSNVTTLNLSNFDTSKVFNMTDMFYGMTKLTNLDIRNANFDAVVYIGYPFNNVPTSATIYVKDETAQDFVKNRALFTGNNVIIP